MAKREQQVYKVIFFQQGQVYEMYARSVSQAELFGFVAVEEIVFGEGSKLVVDPSEDRLRNEFKAVKRTFIPMHAIVRIDQVEKEGVSRITERAKGEGTLMPFPSPGLPGTPRKPDKS